MTKGSKAFIVEGTVFPFDVMVMLGGLDFKAMNKYFQNKDIKYIRKHSKAKATTFNLKGRRVLIVINNWNSVQDLQGLLVHEVYHAVNYIMRHVGVVYSEDSEETFAYLIEWIYRNILEHKEFKKVNKNE